jgi:hypothetical protein
MKKDDDSPKLEHAGQRILKAPLVKPRKRLENQGPNQTIRSETQIKPNQQNMMNSMSQTY